MTCTGANQPALLVQKMPFYSVGSCPACLYRGALKINGTVRVHKMRAPRVAS